MISAIPLLEMPTPEYGLKYASYEDRKNCAELSTRSEQPMAFISDGKLLVCCNCHGGAGTFPLVCFNGLEAHWDSETVAPNGRHDVPEYQGPHDFPAIGLRPVGGMGQTFYRGYETYRWHVTGWKRFREPFLSKDGGKH